MNEFGPAGLNASNVAPDDWVTLLLYGDPMIGQVVQTHVNGSIIVSVPNRNGSRYVVYAQHEGKSWARGTGDDVSASLLLTKSATP